MLTLEIFRWTVVAGLTAALLRWPNPGSPFWALAAGGPFVMARGRQVSADRFREACPT